eukprot:1172975-Rhodomonas_salina.2
MMMMMMMMMLLSESSRQMSAANTLRTALSPCPHFRRSITSLIACTIVLFLLSIVCIFSCSTPIADCGPNPFPPTPSPSPPGPDPEPFRPDPPASRFNRSPSATLEAVEVRCGPLRLQQRRMSALLLRLTGS